MFLSLLAVLSLGLAAQAAEIQLSRDSGVFIVPARLNGVLDLDFVVDSGATEVTIPSRVAAALVRSGTATRDDMLPSATYMLADGTTVEHPRLNIRVLEVGGITVRNVPASVGGSETVLLLGQSFLDRLGTWSVDSRRHVLIVNPDMVVRERPVEASGDRRVAAALEEIGVRYQVDPDGDFALVLPVSEGRTQLLFVNSATQVEDGVEVREVWSPAFQVPGGALPAEIHELAGSLMTGSRWGEMGSWHEVPMGQSSFAVFSVQTPADCTPEELQEALSCVSTLADAMELSLTGGDLY